MKLTRLAALVILVSALPLGAAEKLPKPDRISAPPTPAQVELIRKGVALHDQRDYEGAVAQYKQVLVDNPWEVTALYELAFTYFESGKHQESLATSILGAQCRSVAAPRFHMMIGSALDELGKGKEAIDVYKAAIKLNPRLGLLHYNLAVSLKRAGNPTEAKTEFERALQLDPTHASSHVALAALYREMGYRIPSILAYSRFLELEPESPRAEQAVNTLNAQLTAGVTSSEPNKINIVISMSATKDHADEGDFQGTEMMVSIILASDLMKKPEDATKAAPSPYERLVSVYNMVGESFQNGKLKKGFAAMYYAPYFASLAKDGHAQAFVARVWKSGKVLGASDWETANEEKLATYRAWSESYKWPVE